MIEIESLAGLFEHLGTEATLNGAVLQGLDLTKVDGRLAEFAVGGATFLGCKMTGALARRALDEGALVFPHLDDVPFQAYRPHLYSAKDLYAGFVPDEPTSYKHTPDARVYAHWKRCGGPSPSDIMEALARRLHDHAMQDALDELLHPQAGDRKVVAIMGGHGLARDSAVYRQCVVLARELTRRGFFMCSGGGPGAMEATHLGAMLATRDESAIDEALTILASAPDYHHKRWLASAFHVLERFPVAPSDEAACQSLGIPTWHYGHEPATPFASHIAKFFENSVREDGLITIAKHGIVFAPGSAGTIQEIFQDACQNHYKTLGIVSPMVFLGRDYWTSDKPVYPLLAGLAEGREYSRWVSITDEVAEVIERLTAFDQQAASLGRRTR